MDVPSEFVCPITMEIMVHPLVTRYGQSFERYAIISWIEKGSGECPLTRQPLKMSDLIHNNSLGVKIRNWRRANEVPVNPQGEPANGNSSSLAVDELTSVDGDDDDSFDIAEHIYGTGQFPFTAVAGPEPPPRMMTIAPALSPRSVRSLFPTLRCPMLQSSPSSSPRRRTLTERLRRLPVAPLEGTSF